MPPETVMIDVAVLVGSADEIAVITAVPFFCVAVTTPVAETFATDVSDDTYVTAVFDVPLTTATSVTELPTVRPADGGATTIETGETNGVTMTCAAELFVVLNFDVAMIVAEPGATAVTTPACETVATAVFDDE
jgi:hypothetical protein